MSPLMSNSKTYVDALLYDYAMGTLDESQSLVMSAYLALSPQARHFARLCEDMGGLLLEEQCAPVSMGANAFDRVMARAECMQKDCHQDTRCTKAPYVWQGVEMPGVIADYFGDTCKPFRSLYQGFEVADVPTQCRKSKAQLMRIAPRTAAPHHTHHGIEITLVLQGAFHDEYGVYRRGELIVTDSDVNHTPIADEVEGCVCLAVTTAPVRLTGWVTRFLNPFLSR